MNKDKFLQQSDKCSTRNALHCCQKAYEIWVRLVLQQLGHKKN